MAVLLLSSLLPLAGTAFAAHDAAEVERLSGPNRFATAAAVAADSFPDGSETALLARADLFPDTLSGSVLAGAHDAPILLTRSDVLVQETQSALASLGVRRVVILGGTAAISTAVEDSIKDRGYHVERVGGVDRFDTARLVALEAGGPIGVAPDSEGVERRTAILSTGWNFADALAAGPLAYDGRHPLLLTTRDELHPAAHAALTDDSLDVEQVLIPGGPAAVSEAVEAQVKALGLSVIRVAGRERTETAARVANLTMELRGWTLLDTAGRNEVTLALGSRFPDALVMAPRAARAGTPIVLAQDVDRLGSATTTFLTEHCGDIRTIVIAGGVAAISADTAAAAQAAATCADQEPDLVDIQFLDVSDWHAQLDPVSVFGVGDIGGAAVLSAYWQQDRAANPNTLTFTAGDAFGGSPPLANFFDEVPAVLAMRMMGFDADTFGNHNFDRGVGHLQQMVDLASAPADEQPGEPFQYVSANLENRDEELSGVKDYELFDVDGVVVAVIGVTNPEAPTLVFPGSFGSIEVTDPVAAAMEARAAAIQDGAEVFVALTHMGITGTDDQGEPSGPLTDFAEGVSGFDVIFGDHTDVQYESTINGALVVENRSKGLTYSRTTLTVDRRHGEVHVTENEFVTPFADEVTPDPAIEAMLQPYREQLAEVFDEVIGTATEEFPRGGNIERRQEVAIGNLITDSMRDAYGTDLAFTNGGGIRAPLPSGYEPQDTTLRRPAAGYAAGPPWDLVVGDAFAVLPFGNVVITREVTGAQVWEILEHGVSQVNPDGTATAGQFPQISGFEFTYSADLPPGDRVISVQEEDGTPILPDDTVYTLATNDFVNAGGDGYTMLSDSPNADTSVSRDLMATVLFEYIEAQGTITPTTEGRITRV